MDGNMTTYDVSATSELHVAFVTAKRQMYSTKSKVWAAK
jgi:hypothetical protein